MIKIKKGSKIYVVIALMLLICIPFFCVFLAFGPNTIDMSKNLTKESNFLGGGPGLFKAAYGFNCKYKHKSSITELIDGLESSDSETRLSAAFILAHKGEKAEPAILFLKKTLDDPDTHVRLRAAFALDTLLDPWGNIKRGEIAEFKD